ncbi:hypothetical protein SAMN05444266_101607 [Chitinophaga jiangningensis]|uniref:Uncharacterized protein n=1 Tax=Chitinophaga jiangningensis TaxID=1419482 RepID=A0A1M6WFU8_9BACT|nr:hypothetical protein [Chitinophaga jiangningensis]SHK92486.1 hypothetical protein SAMN05444266_101607 [Chitinophaga jiangningensis]
MRPEIEFFKQLVKSSITDKTLPESILKTDVAGRFNDLADLLDQLLNLNGPQEVLFQADGAHNPNGKVIEFITILPAADVILRIGKVAGGDEIQPDVFYAANELAFATIYSANTIYFSGVTEDITIKFYQR